MRSFRVVLAILLFSWLSLLSGAPADDREPVELMGKYGLAWSLAFSPDGKTLSSCEKYHAYLWDVKAGKRRELEGHTGWIWCVAFSPDGKTLVVTTTDEICLWDTQTAKLTKTISVEDGPNYLAISPTGKVFATGATLDEKVKLWSIETGKVVATLPGNTTAVSCLAFSPDGAALAVAVDKGKILVWDVKTRKVTATLEGPDCTVGSLLFTGEGKVLLAASGDDTIRRWTVATGKSEVTKLDRRSGETMRLAISPNGDMLAVGEVEGVVALWDTGTGKKRADLGKHAWPVYALAFSPDGKTLATSSEKLKGGGDIKLWPVPADK